MNRDDPKLTAYALGELEGAEREAVEARLAEDPAARRVVAEIRAAGRELAEAFKAEPVPGLTDARRQAVEARAVEVDGKPAFGWWRKLAVAAGLLVMVGATAFVALNQLQQGERAAGPGLEANRGGRAPGDTDGRRSGRVQVHFSQFQGASRPPAGAYTLRYGAASFARIESDESLRRAPKAVRLWNGQYCGLQGSVPPGQQPPGAPAPPAAPAPMLPAETKAAPPRVMAVVEDEAEDRKDRRRQARPHAERAHSTEAYDRIVENPFKRVADDPRSTFSIDVDTASYAIVRRDLSQGRLPPPGAVRLEEFVNYFTYVYAEPIDEHPFSAHVEVAGCPWAPRHRLVRVGIKGRQVPRGQRPPSNLVFLLDVSGSMDAPAKLPLVKAALKLLVRELDERDRIAIVVYAGASGLVLPSTPCSERGVILGALASLHAGGSTNGGAGLELAYDVARRNFIRGGTNRVVLCTDGDFNVGVTSQSELLRLIEARAKSGVFLTVLGFGMGNLKDSTLEKLADKGNGNYGYIDSRREARKLFVEGLAGSLITIAKDVKIQVEFNPARVQAYRLLGYENRLLRHQDFNDDTKDAGEIGAGHTVTALYDIVPVGVKVEAPGVDPLKYQSPPRLGPAAASGEILTLKLRYKKPDGQTSTRMEVPVIDHGSTLAQASTDFKFAASVAAFAMLLRDSKHKGSASFDQVLELADAGRGPDPHGYRAEFIELVRKARALK